MERSSVVHSYDAFEVLVSNRTPAGYPVTVVESPAGEGEALCTLSVNDELISALRGLEQDATDETYLAELGAFLFNELFTGVVATLYRTSLGMVRSHNRGLRIRLRITPPELAALPWEYLHDPQEESFLAISAETALVRYIPIALPVRPTTVSLPLRVLVVLANPRDVQPLDVEQESAILNEALAEWVQQERVQIEIVVRASVSKISQAMRRFQPHIFHFVGHGLFENDMAAILLEDEHGNASIVGEEIFRQFFAGCQETRIAVLNACQTATLSTSQPLAGLAPRLLQRQVSAVVAMQHPMPDRAALVFTREFYRSLVLGFPLDAAISEARKGLFLEQGGGSLAWGAPVLFLRAKDGLLLKVAEAEHSALAIPPPPEPTRPPEIPGFVGRDAELTYFAEKLETTHLAVIAGMAGVGKTALAVKLAEWSAQDRDRVFWHSFHEGEGIDSVVWRLAGFLAWHGRHDLWRLLQSAQQTSGKPPPSETLFDYLLQLVRGGRFLLCFDDFHHVDNDPTLNQLVEGLRNVLVAGELSIILTARRMPDFVTLVEFEALEGLSREDARRLLAVHDLNLTAVQTEELYQTTGGNAEFLTLAIAVLRQAKNPDLLLNRLAESDDIERYLLQEVDETLTGQERGVMNSVAVLLGYPGTRNAIESVLSAGNVFRTLRGLTERHLLVARDSEAGREYVQHAIVQAFYYEQMSQRERRGMHRRAGNFYEREDPDWLRAGIHFERAGEYEHAAQVAIKDVWGLINRGQARALRGLLERLEAAQSDPIQLAMVKNAEGLTYTFLMEKDLARQVYTETLALASELVDEPRVRTLKARAYRGMGELLYLENPQIALNWLQDGLGVLGDNHTEEKAALYIRIGTAHLHLGNYQEAILAHKQGLDLLPAGPSQLRITAYLDLNGVYFYLGDTKRARAYAEQALAISEALHDYFQTVDILVSLGADKYTAGEWKDAVVGLQRALTLASSLGSEYLQASAAINLGGIYTYMGEFTMAQELLHHSLAIARKHALNLLEAFVQLRLAELHLKLQDLSTTAVHLTEAARLAVELEQNSLLVAIYCQWAEYRLATSDFPNARQDVERSIHLAQELGEKIQEGVGKRLMGQILLAQGEQQRALQAFTESLVLLVDQDVYEAARTKRAWGEALLEIGHEEKGSTLLIEAQATFQILNARPELESIQELLQAVQG